MGESEVSRQGEYDVAAYFVFVLLGVAVMFPWNAAVLAVDYFASLYGPKSTFFTLLPIVYTAPQVPMNALVVWKGDAVSVRYRLWGAMATMIATMILIPAVAASGPASVYVLLVLMGAATAVFQPSLFGLSGQFPDMYTQAQMTGQGVAGIIASLARIITKATITGKGVTTASIVFFVISAVVLLMAGFGLLIFLRSDFARRHMSQASGQDESEDTLLAGPAEFEAKIDTPLADRSRDDDRLRLGEEGNGEKGAEEEEEGERLSLWERISLIGYPMSGVFLVFFITFLIFPGVIDAIPYHATMGTPAIAKDEWWPILLLLEFNLCDTTGRFLAARINWNERVTFWVSIVRSITIPLFIFIARSTPPTGGIVFSNDVSAIVVMLVFAFTNGLTASRAMILAPQLTPKKDREAAGFLMGLALQGGILAGAAGAFGVTRAVA